MAVGTVSGISDDVWQLIATTTVSSGTSATVATGLSGAYKELMVVYRGVTTNANCGLHMTVNADTSSSSYGFTTTWQAAYSDVRDNVIPVTGYTSYTDHKMGYLKIKNTNQAIPHTVEGGGYVADSISGVYAPSTAATVNSLEFKTSNGTSTFTAGTVLVYGIAA